MTASSTLSSGPRAGVPVARGAVVMILLLCQTRLYHGLVADDTGDLPEMGNAARPDDQGGIAREELFRRLVVLVGGLRVGVGLDGRKGIDVFEKLGDRVFGAVGVDL